MLLLILFSAYDSMGSRGVLCLWPFGAGRVRRRSFPLLAICFNFVPPARSGLIIIDLIKACPCNPLELQGVGGETIEPG